MMEKENEAQKNQVALLQNENLEKQIKIQKDGLENL